MAPQFIQVESLLISVVLVTMYSVVLAFDPFSCDELMLYSHMPSPSRAASEQVFSFFTNVTYVSPFDCHSLHIVNSVMMDFGIVGDNFLVRVDYLIDGEFAFQEFVSA
jgi:hypothetical protein